MSKLNTMSVTMSSRDWQKFSELPWIVFIWRSKNLPGGTDWMTWVEKCVSLSETAGSTCPFGCGMGCPASFIYKHQSSATAMFTAEEVNHLQVMWQKRDKRDTSEGSPRLTCNKIWITPWLQYLGHKLQPFLCCWEGTVITSYHSVNGLNTAKELFRRRYY